MGNRFDGCGFFLAEYMRFREVTSFSICSLLDVVVSRVCVIIFNDRLRDCSDSYVLLSVNNRRFQSNYSKSTFK